MLDQIAPCPSAPAAGAPAAHYLCAAVFELLHDGVLVHDADGRLLMRNRGAERLLGAAAGAAAASPTWPARWPDGRAVESDEHPIAAALRAGTRRTAVLAVRPVGDDERWLEVVSAPLPDPDGGQRCGVVTTLRDVTAERRAAERAAELAATAERARAEAEAVLEVVDDAVYLFAPDGSLRRANAAGRACSTALLGTTSPTGQALEEASGVRTPDGRPASDVLAPALGGERAEVELVWPAPGGAVRRGHAVALPLRDAAGAVTGAVVVTRDITDLHEAIADRARLDGAVKAIRRAAHELNNRLTTLAVYGELLPDMVEGEPAELASELAAEAVAAGALLNRMQNVIRFAETEFGGQAMLDVEAATAPSP